MIFLIFSLLIIICPTSVIYYMNFRYFFFLFPYDFSFIFSFSPLILKQLLFTFVVYFGISFQRFGYSSWYIFLFIFFLHLVSLFRCHFKKCWWDTFFPLIWENAREWRPSTTSFTFIHFCLIFDITFVFLPLYICISFSLFSQLELEIIKDQPKTHTLSLCLSRRSDNTLTPTINSYSYIRENQIVVVGLLSRKAYDAVANHFHFYISLCLYNIGSSMS
jgi:hypothetical protein